jgi:hypothetical protein
MNSDDVPNAVTFTERCRRMLSEQPDQGEFTLSRGGLETLVLDSERYAERNRADAEKAAAAAALVARRTPSSLTAQFEQIRHRYPGSTLEAIEHGAHWLTVPDVPLPKGFNRKKTTFYVEVPPGYPGVSPARFWVDGDVRYRGGGLPHLSYLYEKRGVERLLCFWCVQRWSPWDTLRGYVQAMQQFFPATLYSTKRESSASA